MTCSRLTKSTELGNPVELDRYRRLHYDGQRLITGWFHKACVGQDSIGADSFEPFIYAWIAFNAWGSCVTSLDWERARNRKADGWIDALMLCEWVNRDFDRLVTHSPLSDYAYAFYGLWPVFKAQKIRSKGVARYNWGNREDAIQYYFAQGIRSYQPQCWQDHERVGTPVPLDWPHTLAVLYQVRCNLFHGEKAAHSEMDATIVGSGLRVLVHFLHEAGYIGLTGG